MARAYAVTLGAPVSSAFPSAATTGVPAGTSLTASGPVTVDTAGATIQGLDIAGRLTVNADNVTVKNCRLDTSGDFWGVMANGANLTIQDCTLIGGPNTQAPLAAFSTGYFHAYRLDVSGAGDGITFTANCWVYDSYVHDLYTDAGTHNDGMNAYSGLGMRAIHNTILNSHDQTSCITVGSPSPGGPATEIDCSNNLFAGGGYAVYGGMGGGTGISVRNNTFDRRFFSTCGFFGPVAFWENTNGNVWSGNTYDDNTIIPSP